MTGIRNGTGKVYICGKYSDVQEDHIIPELCLEFSRFDQDIG